ncbi:hypothetical protein KR059_012829 [Drosophila kikkawai]|nr:hypothetical protein KR059_012829 [Drosophila kikkawai]
MKFRLKTFCFVVPLDIGCLIIAVILILFELLAPPLHDPGPAGSPGRRLAAAYRLLNIVHSLGCMLLFAAYFLRFSLLVLAFMASLILHMVMLPVFLFLDIFVWRTDTLDVTIAFVGVCKLYYY